MGMKILWLLGCAVIIITVSVVSYYQGKKAGAKLQLDKILEDLDSFVENSFKGS